MKQISIILFWLCLFTLCSISINNHLNTTKIISKTTEPQIEQPIKHDNDIKFEHPVYKGQKYEIIHPVYRGEPYEIKLLK